MADQIEIPQRDNEQPPRQQQQESFGSTKRFHIVFTSFKLLTIMHFNSQPTDALSHAVLQLYVIFEVIYFIALIQVTRPTSPNIIYKYLYIIFGMLGAKLLLWTSLSLVMWLIVNICLLLFALASSGLLAQVPDWLQEIVQLFNDVPVSEV